MIESLNRLTISEALCIAERQTAETQKAKDSGDPKGKERVQRWPDTPSPAPILKEHGVPGSMKEENAD